MVSMVSFPFALRHTLSHIAAVPSGNTKKLLLPFSRRNHALVFTLKYLLLPNSKREKATLLTEKTAREKGKSVLGGKITHAHTQNY